MYLADLGADVIKVEPPEGDGSRNVYTTPELGDMSKAHLVYNRSKRGIALDLTSLNGRRALLDLAACSDVLITSLRKKFCLSHGLSYQALRTANPTLVYCTVSGYGDEGPEADKPGLDPVIQARSGVLHKHRAPDDTPMQALSTNLFDTSGSMMLAFAIMTALWHRERTGNGQHVSISLLNVAVAVQAYQLVKVKGKGDTIPDIRGGASFSSYRCSDGKWLLPVFVTPSQWRALCQALGVPDLENVPEFATHPSRSEHFTELYDLLAAVFSGRPRMEWLSLLSKDVPCAPVASQEELLADPQVVANQMFIKQAHPTVGEVTMMNLPIGFSDIERTLPGPAPRLGQHTGDVLAELGYTPQQIAALRTPPSVV